MKKVITILIIIITIIIIGIFGIKVYIKKDEQKRYNEIKESVKKAVEWQIKATQPYCTLVHGIPDNMKSNSGGHMQSKHLINSGYIKKEELLDIDKKSYCDVYVVTRDDHVEELNPKKGCTVYYEYYLKCKNYKDKGYFNWEG